VPVAFKKGGGEIFVIFRKEKGKVAFNIFFRKNSLKSITKIKFKIKIKVKKVKRLKKDR